MLYFTVPQDIVILLLQLYALRKLMQGPETIPKAPLGNNARPLQPLHHRTVRTNIDFKKIEVSVSRRAGRLHPESLLVQRTALTLGSSTPTLP